MYFKSSKHKCSHPRRPNIEFMLFSCSNPMILRWLHLCRQKFSSQVASRVKKQPFSNWSSFSKEDKYYFWNVFLYWMNSISNSLLSLITERRLNSHCVLARWVHLLSFLFFCFICLRILQSLLTSAKRHTGKNVEHADFCSKCMCMNLSFFYCVPQLWCAIKRTLTC